MNEALYNRIWTYTVKHKAEYVAQDPEAISTAIYNDIIKFATWKLPPHSDIEGTREVIECINAALSFG